MNCPEMVLEALRLRVPFVDCLWSASHNRFLLVYRRDGHQALLRILEDEEGNFMHPDLWNTVVWLVERDCAWMSNYSQQKRFLDMLDEKKNREEKVLQANLSDMIRMGLAPRLKHEMTKGSLRRA